MKQYLLCLQSMKAYIQIYLEMARLKASIFIKDHKFMEEEAEMNNFVRKNQQSFCTYNQFIGFINYCQMQSME